MSKQKFRNYKRVKEGRCLYKDQTSSDAVVTNDIGESGGYSPPATASSCAKGGRALGDDRLSPVSGGNGGTLNIGFIVDLADLGIFSEPGECPYGFGGCPCICPLYSNKLYGPFWFTNGTVIYGGDCARPVGRLSSGCWTCIQ